MSDLLATGAGVVLRRFRASDLEAFHAWRTDPEVARYQSWEPMDRMQAARFISAVQSAQIPLHGQWSQIIVALPDDEPVGDMGLFLSEDGREAEIGISLARAAQGLGLAKAAMRAAIRFLFDSTEIERCVLWSDARNAASLALIRTLGAQRIGQEMTVLPDGSTLLELQFEVARDAPR